jgi:hypothetical protein
MIELLLSRDRKFETIIEGLSESFKIYIFKIKKVLLKENTNYL